MFFFIGPLLTGKKIKKKPHLLTSTAFANSIVGLDMIHFQTQDTLLKGELQNLKVQDRDIGDGIMAWALGNKTVTAEEVSRVT